MGLSARLGPFVVGVVAVLVASGCDELPDIVANVCGNKLVEPSANEACDGFADAPSGGEDPPACAPPGDRFQCQYVHDAQHDCPVGYGAGLDGLCRKGAGAFSEAVTRTPVTGTNLSIADHDGDGRDDILVSSPRASDAKAVFFDSGGFVRETVPLVLGAVLHAPITARIGLDRNADVVLPSAAGMLLMQGKPGPSFESRGYAPVVVPLAVLPVSVPEAALVPPDKSEGLGGHYVPGYIIEQGDALLVLAGYDEPTVVAEIPDASLADIMGVITTELDAAQPFAAASDEVIFALAGDPGRLLVITPNVDVNARRVLELADFGPARRLLRGPFRVDSRLGIAVGTPVDHGRYMQLIEVTPPGVLTSQELLIGKGDDTSNDPVLIGSYDFGAVKAPFAVFPNRLAIHPLGCPGEHGECLIDVFFNPGIYPWTTAAFDDGKGVVVTGSNLSTGVHVLRNNVGQPAVAALFVSTESPVQRIEAGDLDGDTVGDFLLTTRSGPPGCADDSRLSVAWGEDTGLPREVDPVADMPGLEGLALATFTTSGGIDGATDMVVTTRCEDEHRAGYFVGSPSRQLQSPFPILDPLPQGPDGGTINAGDVPVVAADVGAPEGTGPDGLDDLLVFIGDPDYVGIRPLLAGPDGDLTLGSVWKVAQIDDPTMQVTALATAHAKAVNLDDDNELELVVVLSHAEATAFEEAVYRPHLYVGNLSDGKMVFDEVAVSGGGLDWKLGAAKLATYNVASTVTSQLVVSDLNGDGRLDIAVRLMVIDVAATTIEPSSYVTTFMASDDGYLEQPFPASDGGVIATMIDVDDKIAGMSLAVATGSELSFCGAVDGVFACPKSLKLDEGTIIGAAMADFDRDGVADLALARAEGISVYRQQTEQDGVARVE